MVQYLIGICCYFRPHLACYTYSAILTHITVISSWSTQALPKHFDTIIEKYETQAAGWKV